MKTKTLGKNRNRRSLVITESIMILVALIWFVPVYYLIVTTLKTPQDATNNPLGLPSPFVFGNYAYAWEKMEYPRAFFNTAFITVASVALIIILGGMAGYAIARTKTKAGTRMFLLFMAGLVVPFQMNIISLYSIVKNLGLMNSHLSVILVNVAVNLPQAVFLLKEFIESTIPLELEEAAEIDGCSVPGKFFRIVFPLLKPVIATLAIITTLNVWNEFMTPLLLLQTRDKGVILQEVSRNIGQFSTDWTAMFPMMMLGVAPLIIFYIFMQKYIISGVAAGAVKG
ncbi:carbohydrate ABC transporter permease [Ruminococcaceae bacterium OttesenSCG-928-A16]|nr:carbohydrate ABC transporter permease [Ruminococcaceae bacterium OttesenSCG-928-A16]